MLFDEVFANLDQSLQAELMEKMPLIGKHKTMFFVTHDMRVASKMPQILVMGKGSNLGLGTHSELLKDCHLYKNLWGFENTLNSDGNGNGR